MNEEAREAGVAPDINEIPFSSTSTAALDKADIAEEMMQEEDDEEKENEYVAFQGKLDEAIAILKQHQDICAVQLKGDYTCKRFLQKFPTDGKYSCHMRLVDSKVVIYEVPSQVHDVMAQEAFRQFVVQDPSIRSLGSADIQINATTLLRPDQSFRVRPNNGFVERGRDYAGQSLPSVVIEVAVTESYSSIFGLPAIYFSTGENGIRGVLLIIIRKSKRNGRYQMVACYYRHDSDTPTRLMSFGEYLNIKTANTILEYSHADAAALNGVDRGGPPCDENNRDFYRFPIESEDLWHGCTPDVIANNNVPAYYFLDLYELHRECLG
jgi:hypothetical protein